MTTSIAEYSQTEAALAELRSRFHNATFDVTTKDGMQGAKAARAELRGYRVALEKKRTEIKAPALQRCREIDSEAQRITAELVALEDPIDAQIKLEEDRKEAERQAKVRAEQQRVEDIQGRIRELRGALQVVTRYSCTAAEIAEHISDLEAVPVDETFAEFLDAARAAKAETLNQLRQTHDAALAREAEAERLKAERAELERLRAEDAKRQAEARELERKAVEEREAADRKAQAERERLAEEERQKALAEAAEIRRKAELEAEHQRREQAAEAKRLAEESARLERERAEQQRAARERAIAEATLHDAAREAVALLRELNQGNHITTLKLAAALAREPKASKPTKRKAA